MRFLTLFSGIGTVGANKMINTIVKESDFATAIRTLDGAKKLPKEPDVVQLIMKLADNNQDCQWCFEMAVSTLTPILKENYADSFEARAKDFELLLKLSDKQSIQSFLETYMLNPISTTQASKPELDDVVTLITVHSAKGAEADICYLANLNVGQYPHSRASSFDEVEEERRVLYVAMTRAKNELILSKCTESFFSPEKYDVVNGQQVKLPSYFLTNLPTQYAQRKTQTNNDWRTHQYHHSLPKPNFGVGLMVDDEFEWLDD